MPFIKRGRACCLITLLIFLAGSLIVASTACFAEDIKFSEGIIPSTGSVKGTGGAIGNTYKDKTDAVIGANNFLVEGVVKADGGLVTQNVATQAAEDAMTKTDGAMWLRSDIDSSTWVSKSSPSASSDMVRAIASDAAYIYIAGRVGPSYCYVEKRAKSDGALVWAQTEDVAVSPAEQFNCIALDTDYIYLGGIDSTPGANNYEWRIEKRRKSDGGLEWFQAENFSAVAGGDILYGIAVDDTYIYVVGDDYTLAATNCRWHMEKRLKSTGSLVGGWTQTDNPSSYYDTAQCVAADADGFIYIGGYDNTKANGQRQWRIEKRLKTTGAYPVGGGLITANYQMGYTNDARSIITDANFIYIGGNYYGQWCVEKRSKADGSLTGGWTKSSNPSSLENANAITMDNSYVYVCGEIFNNWCTEKRRKSDGGLEWSNVYSPAGFRTRPFSITSDNDYLYLAGEDGTAGGEWRIEKQTKGFIDVGLRAQNGAQTVRIAIEPTDSPPTSGLRVYKNNRTYGIGLIGPTDTQYQTYDSGLRVQTASGPKAVGKI
ncbi:MAG: hypothetical protein Q7S30_03405 [Candidatus Omnitrophota bacterium]|nr:hypothetical protein [Candidatus Omnitrophota bacterium]